MSVAKAKAKETKGKQKALPKLKSILANPNKTKCPVLDEKELNDLKFLLKAAIQESELAPRAFATQKGICLGMESSLRKINNQSSSCVFISLSIKPNYIIGLIARNAETKDERQPVYAQPKLENFTEEIFGVQAMCMVFTKDFLQIYGNISEWVDERKKPARVKKVSEAIKKTLKKKVKKSKTEIPVPFKEGATKADHIAKKCSDDFIAFDNDDRREKNSKLDGDKAIDALSEIIDKIPKSKYQNQPSQILTPIEPMEIDRDHDLKNTAENAVINDAEVSDYDDFLEEEYKTLTVHKIKGNPNKKPKKKRNKNKKKKTK